MTLSTDLIAAAGRALDLETELAETKARLAELSRPQVPAVHSDRIVDSIGVNTHLHYNSSVYANIDQIEAALVELGVRHIRDYPVNLTALRRLNGRGIKASGIIGHPDQGTWAQFDYLGAIKSNPALFSQAELTNEPDITIASGWAQKMRDLNAKVKAAGLGVPLIGPSLTWPARVESNLTRAAQLGDLGVPWNVHPYPGGVAGDISPTRLAGDTAACKAVADRPVYVTESGYHNQTPSDTTHRGCTETEAATYLPRLFLHNFLQGVTRTYSYEFADQGTTGAEKRFGLIRRDYTRKPAFQSLRALIAALADPGPAYTPTPVGLELSGPADLRTIVVGKRDGTHHIILWRTVTHGTADVTVTVNGTTVRVGAQAIVVPVA